MHHRYRILCVLAILTSTDASAWSRMAEAEISSFNGMPCFTISKREERRNGTPMLGALMVYDLSIKPPGAVWSFILPGATPLPMHAKTCYLYGQVPTGAESTAATMLKTDRKCSLFLNGRPDDPSDSTCGYRGKFCLIIDTLGRQKIIAISKDMPEWRTNSAQPIHPPIVGLTQAVFAKTARAYLPSSSRFAGALNHCSGGTTCDSFGSSM